MVLGFLLSYQYNYTKKRSMEQIAKNQLNNEELLREKLIEEKEGNRELVKKLQEIQREVTKVERSIGEQQSHAKEIVNELEQVRMLGGLTAVEGPGITVTMNDSKSIPSQDDIDISKYIVHEADILRVVNELLAAGAEAIDINGQRWVSNSAIRCIGPTVIVNGIKSAAPFKITAIGATETLDSALQMPGGIMELLKDYRQLDVSIAKHEDVKIAAYLGEKLAKK